MCFKQYILLLFITLGVFSFTSGMAQQPTYKCKKAVGEDFTSEKFWDHADSIPFFVDLKTGEKADLPTKAKMLWNDSSLFLKVDMADQHLWAKQTRNEDTIFFDQAFELFIDPDGDGLNYVECEVNALGTTWDLLMAKPYKEGGDAISCYDMKGVQKKIVLNGTLNNPSDTDEGWVLYLAIPFENFRGLCTKFKPKEGDSWRMNLVRVHWELDASRGEYLKVKNSETGRNMVKYWVWSPHGIVNMHKPEHFGFVVFM